MTSKYTSEIRGYIEENCKGKTTAELTQMINQTFGTAYTERQIRDYKKNYGLRMGRAEFEPAIKDFIFSHYKKISTKKLTDMVNHKFGTEFTKQQIFDFKVRHKLRSSYTNKGVSPATCLPVGTERKHQGHTWIKVDEHEKWKEKGRYIWEKEHGEIPEGYELIYLDGNLENYDLVNLDIVKKSESFYMNKKHLRSGNAELTQTGILIAKLAVKTYEMSKEKGERKEGKKV